MIHTYSPCISNDDSDCNALTVGTATAAKGVTSAGYRQASPAEMAKRRCFVRSADQTGLAKRLSGRSFIIFVWDASGEAPMQFLPGLQERFLRGRMRLRNYP